jgi:hypothetical protein
MANVTTMKNAELCGGHGEQRVAEARRDLVERELAPRAERAHEGEHVRHHLEPAGGSHQLPGRHVGHHVAAGQLAGRAEELPHERRIGR